MTLFEKLFSKFVVQKITLILLEKIVRKGHRIVLKLLLNLLINFLLNKVDNFKKILSFSIANVNGVEMGV